MVVLAVWDWLGNKPWDGELTYFDMIATIISLVIGSFAGGQVISVSRVRAEARRDMYSDLLPMTRRLPIGIEESLSWRRAARASQSLAKLLTYSERKGWAAYERHLPIDSDGQETYERAIVDASILAEYQKGIRGGSDELHGNYNGTQVRLHEYRESFFETLDQEAMKKDSERLIAYLERKLRPGSIWRRARTRMLAFGLSRPRLRSSQD